MTTIWEYLDDTIITGNFNHDYHDNQNIAHPYFRPLKFLLGTQDEFLYLKVKIQVFHLYVGNDTGQAEG